MSKSTCYKCEAEIELADEDEFAIHPMCDECQSDFEDWFNRQLAVFNK